MSKPMQIIEKENIQFYRLKKNPQLVSIFVASKYLLVWYCHAKEFWNFRFSFGKETKLRKKERCSLFPLPWDFIESFIFLITFLNFNFFLSTFNLDVFSPADILLRLFFLCPCLEGNWLRVFRFSKAASGIRK